MFDALSSPIRREILWRVWDEELAASTIAEAFAVSAPTISQHLALLREAGLLAMRADGTFRRYRAVKDAMPALDELLAGARSGWRFEGPDGGVAGIAARNTIAVVAAVEAACRPLEAFHAFTDPVRFGAWLGGPVSLTDACISIPVDSGLVLQGRCSRLAPPSLIEVCWDVQAEAVPLPGPSERALLTFFPVPAGTHVEVVQLVRNAAQAKFMATAWESLLGRFRAYFDVNV